jgi:SAM-dependent methyltransferase
MADADVEGQFWNSPRIVQIFAQDSPSEVIAAYLASHPGSPGTLALDIGCGGGRHTELLASSGYDVWACDAHAAMVAETSARLGPTMSGRVRQAEMSKLPYARRSFQLVLASGVFHNAYSVDELLRSLAEAARVTAHGGVLYVNMFVRNGLSLDDQRLEAMAGTPDVYLTEDDLRMVLMSPTALRALFAEVGLVERERRLYIKEEFSGQRDVYQGWLHVS